MMRPFALAAALALTIWPARVHAQDYRVRLDSRAQAVSFRGLVRDSIDATLVVPAGAGASATPDGYAVRCGISTYCYFFRAGEVLRGVPVTTSASAVLWGLGVEGLSLRATGRLVADLGSDKVWPATNPAAQLIEGYVEYQRAAIVARVGRQLEMSRLEPIGFDGAWLKGRVAAASLEFTGYGGWGLGQAAALSASSPALNPLDEWRPRDRQIVAGAEAAWLYRALDVRGEYRREMDPEDDYFVSERAAMSLAARVAMLRLTGGFDYNVAEGHLGSADVTLSYVQPRFSITGGARRYDPYFSLWTLWGAFSPVPYRAVNASAEVRATDWLSLRWRGERYRYDEAGISTGLVPQLQDRGWRASTGATATLDSRWSLDGNFGLERGPGAAARFADGAVRFTPSETYSFDVYGGTMARPLELRYYDATSRWIGGRGEWQISPQRRVWGDVAYVADDRDRPDNAASSMTQLRVRTGLSLVFGSGADRPALPPGRMPGR